MVTVHFFTLLLLHSFLVMSSTASLLEELAPFELQNHLPSFPIKFQMPIGDRITQYLYFPEDSAANYQSTLMRCHALGAKLWSPSGPTTTEKEMLACAILNPVWIKTPPTFQQSQCSVMLPGGMIVSSAELCKRSFGSLCLVN